MKIATLAIIRNDDQVLLGLRKTGKIGKGTYNGPGGKREPRDRTLVDCLIRETFEELDIRLVRKDVKKIAKITFFNGGEPGWEVHVYRARRYRRTPRETKDMKPAHFPVSRIPYARMLQSDRAWFRRALTGRKFCANVYYRTKQAKGFSDIKFLKADF